MNWRDGHGRGRSGAKASAYVGNGRLFSVDELAAIAHDEARRAEVRQIAAVCLVARQNGTPSPAETDLGRELSRDHYAGLLANNPFFENEPLPGTRLSDEAGLIPLVRLSNGSVFSVPLTALARNALVVGSTGSGKTSFTRLVVLSAVRHGASVCIWDQKHGEFGSSETFAHDDQPFVVLHAEEVPWALLEPPPGVPFNAWTIIFARVLKKAFSLFASTRFLISVLEKLWQQPRAPGTAPSWNELVRTLEGLNARPGSRDWQHRDSVGPVAKGIQRELPAAAKCVRSDFWHHAQRNAQCIVIRTDRLSDEVSQFLVSLSLQWAYEYRSRVDIERSRQLLFVLDDALSHARGSAHTDAQEVNALADLCVRARSKKLGVVVASQSWELLSPALRTNCDLIAICSASGGDVEELRRDLLLTDAQAARLATLTPGEAVVLSRATWKKPVLGRFPEVR